MPAKRKPAAKPRRKPRKPTNDRPTRDEYHERVEFAAQQLRTRFYPSQIVRALIRKFAVSERVAQNLLSVAQEEIRAIREIRTGRNELEIAIDFYESVIQDAAASTKEKIAAQTRIDKLLGLEKAALGDASRETLILALLDELKKPPPEEIPE